MNIYWMQNRKASPGEAEKLFFLQNSPAQCSGWALQIRERGPQPSSEPGTAWCWSVQSRVCSLDHEHHTSAFWLFFPPPIHPPTSHISPCQLSLGTEWLPAVWFPSSPKPLGFIPLHGLHLTLHCSLLAAPHICSPGGFVMLLSL